MHCRFDGEQKKILLVHDDLARIDEFFSDHLAKTYSQAN